LMLHNGCPHSTIYMGKLHVFSPYQSQATSMCALYYSDNTHAMHKSMFPLHLSNEQLGDIYLDKHAVDKNGTTPTATSRVLSHFHGDVVLDPWKDLPQGGGEMMRGIQRTSPWTWTSRQRTHASSIQR